MIILLINKFQNFMLCHDYGEIYYIIDMKIWFIICFIFEISTLHLDVNQCFLGKTSIESIMIANEWIDLSILNLIEVNM